ncbi:haloacid dehalogenase-like hydrolase [Amycolatopsis echigonensis]|uniref:Haloacid dehalogenase-like hydrolase n=1 Tax=Amycolatopsis echigonensis TaxID=2576905 RepID=A0A2N3WAM5_9PSEU|nr:haloacid dehalogenase-like hydrolase [Amycolatopsis niigatensis]MBB2506337.1 haloacid dehalogenase-like hydrolase [Amycolatopsis echigonensis]PKV90926.1 phosphoglycolate phosphatase-like HAD superfamily hydrolase [Amycolatopsis niigatensis]
MTAIRTHRLVLWDIDHTLVDYTGLGIGWYGAALAAATGVEYRTHPDFGGRTERAITADVLTLHGIEPDEETIQRMWRELIAAVERARASLPEEGRALDGAAAALADFAGREGVVQSLVTGNLPEISRHKLAALGLDKHLDLEIGGYGSLSARRADLVPHAVKAAETKHGTQFPAESVVILGDTPHDIEAALDYGAVAIGVATGWFSAEQLTDAGAHRVLPDLSDLSAVRSAVLGHP